MIKSESLANMNEDAEGKVDMLSNIWSIDMERIIIDNYVLVDEQLEMRPDILSYATGIDVDKILKFNGIANPFELVRGMVIAIPTASSFDDATTVLNVSQAKLQRQKLISTDQLLEKIAKQSSNAKFTPSKKQSESSNFTKSEDGILRF